MVVGKIVEWLLKRERLVIVSCLVSVVAIAWLYLIVMFVGMDMTSVEAMSEMTQVSSWTVTEAVLIFSMWAIMMVGMMVPGAAPTILLYARVCRKHRIGNHPLVPTGAFFAGYITVWTVFSLLATLLQWGLVQATLLSPMMVSTSPLLSGSILILAGIYQWTPQKYACLKHCRSPVEFLSKRWRNGSSGAYKMGLEHGIYCLGCCWVLMALLFVGGVMNLFWVAAITVFVLMEKIIRFGQVIGQVSAIILIVSGAILITLN